MSSHDNNSYAAPRLASMARPGTSLESSSGDPSPAGGVAAAAPLRGGSGDLSPYQPDKQWPAQPGAAAAAAPTGACVAGDAASERRAALLLVLLARCGTDADAFAKHSLAHVLTEQLQQGGARERYLAGERWVTVLLAEGVRGHTC